MFMTKNIMSSKLYLARENCVECVQSVNANVKCEAQLLQWNVQSVKG